MSTSTIHVGDCRDVLATLPDASIDSIVTDPPYELGFMGKAWDATGIANNVDMWRECLRVLKPGGHLLAFSGSRTYHRMACAIEDAGFEIRDQIMWVYGSGFPKSLDVSKAIDKSTGENRQRQLRFTEWMRLSGLSQQQCAEIIKCWAKNDATAKAMAQHYYSDKQQPAIPTADIFDTLRPYLPEVPEEIERLVAERTGIEWTAYKQRPVLGDRLVPKGHSFAGETYGNNSSSVKVDVTAPATPEAEQWSGWGTALKPAHEPIVLARKPLIGTVAANVLQHGTGALNIDGCRVAMSPDDYSKLSAGVEAIRARGGTMQNSWKNSSDLSGANPANAAGRWPANFIHDGSDEITDLMADAARFFYCAKASKTDRNEGLDGFEEKIGGSMTGAEYREGKPTNHPIRANHHPTVKPTDLMRYLCRLITPPNGVVLDLFTGSGSTGKAAILERFNFVGIEQDPDYAAIAEARIKHALNSREETLFND